MVDPESQRRPLYQQDAYTPWDDDVAMNELAQAKRVSDIAKALLRLLAKELQSCQPPHSAHIHLSGFSQPEIDTLISLCSHNGSVRWHRVSWSNQSHKDLPRMGLEDRRQNICTILKRSCKFKRHLRIQVSHDGSWHPIDAPGGRLKDIAMAPTLKLEELLHAKGGSRSSSIRLLKKDRLILAKSITRSLFYLIGSPLLSEVWKTEAIYVAQPHDPRTDIYKPYVVREITKEMMLKEIGGSAFVLHLAVILWELLFGRRIVILPEDEEHDGEDENISLFNALGREECDLRESCIEKPFLDIIANCLDLYPENELDDQELRSKVYWNILKPLQTYVEAYQPDIPAASAYHTASRLSQKYEDKTTRESSRTRTSLLGPSAAHDPYPSIKSKVHFINKRLAYCGDAHKINWTPRDLRSLSEEPGPDANGRFPPYVLPQMLSSETTSTPSLRRLKHDDYRIGIVCALAKEHLAVRSLFDEKHQHLEIPLGDTNQYALGRLAHHNVVTACLPAGNYGTSPAAQIMTNMKRTFTSVEHYLLVGIGGGVPTKENDIRLGDVVVSLPEGGFPGVIQYDRGKDVENGDFEQTGALPPPPHALLNVISDLRSDPDLPSDPLQPHIKRISDLRPEYGHPGAGKDKLLQVEAVSLNGSTQKNDGWHNSHAVEIRSQPKIHYGLIASGNQVKKNPASRDRLGQKYNALCVEMEAAGIASVTQCLVIRGICDYADSDKNKVWQEYASATAAAYAKLLLSNLRRQA
ncbi:predicted protein [Aspergillus terreus NIH2624]|uniref:DUF7580 domain-containing protein n=1 Tax=Aspergillus terreus (strain NIH 2624 / FGSC A1156) TaxID=341663 RepID=Q0CQ27_ASPTN|nr:uncharacterized protein ATEG_04207 [Aspergillus terreus NIH2624]EAU36009.1 predicted protein [Aspergillus terreus NIH2624]